MLVEMELMARGIMNFVECSNAASCLAALATDPRAMIVIDTEHEERELIKVLRGAQGPHRMDTRPIYLIPYTPSEKILAYSIEYNIAQLHTGELTKGQIQINLDELQRYGQRTVFEAETYAKVVKARKSHKKQEVRELLVKLCEREPENIQASNELAATLCEMDLWREAEVQLIEAVAKYPFDTRAKHLLARCFMKRNDFSKARYYLEQASLLSPFNAERLCDLGQIFLDQYQLAEALGTFREVLSLDPDLHEGKIGEAQCELLLSDANEALKVVRQFEDPYEFASVFNGSAIIAVRMGHYPKGIKLYKAAVSYLVDHPYLLSRVFFNMGIGLWKWGKGSLAVAAFEKAVELDGTNDKAQFNADFVRVKLQALEGGDTYVNPEEGPFNTLNRIDTMDDFDGINEEDFSDLGSGT